MTLHASLDAAALDGLVALRRDLHAHPELRFEERRTAGIVAGRLAALGLEVHSGLGGTGVVGTIRGEGPGAILLRADMDALPIAEESGVAHASRHPGRMHACGHDGHVAMLLGAADALARGPKPGGTVHLVFQPGEEGGAGALRMIEDGLLDLFPVEACFGLHNWPTLPIGHFGICAGPVMAAGVRFTILIEGRGGHAAQPHLAVDPIPVGCALVGQLQTLVSRRTDPLAAAVLSVCMFNAGSSDNVLPSSAEIRGTLRTLDGDVMARLRDGMAALVEGVSAAHGARGRVTFHGAYPLTANAPAEARFAAETMRHLVGPDAVEEPTPPNMTSEDFGFMLERRPGAYALIGTAEPGRPSPALHAPTFDFNDAAIPLGVGYWLGIARGWWGRDAA
ncbi:amidohydrolase [Lichenibacterium minor]|uniref:Amidohydrolase n=1 Tax=Lichenibacterium minor TaxID=2316528 RepID=A0A4Q2U0Z8_9HYPH|nr:amidohydrolase [Lichenibacterium minor]RYC29942.1 amidohydrolase [Lichenibacterium minor]